MRQWQLSIYASSGINGAAISAANAAKRIKHRAGGGGRHKYGGENGISAIGVRGASARISIKRNRIWRWRSRRGGK